MLIIGPEFCSGMTHFGFPSECNGAYVLFSQIIFLPHCRIEICHLWYLGFLKH